MPAAMITMFNAIWFSLQRRWIIGRPWPVLMLASALLLGGCSMLRIGYNQAPELMYWWFDGYADFDDAQSQRARAAIDEVHRWHRRDQLPGLAEQLARLQKDVQQPTTPAAVCTWQGEIQQRVDALVAQALPPAIDIAATLTPAQVQNIERQQAKKLAEFREKNLQPDLAERREQSLKRTVDRVETLYGRLDAAQRERIARALAASPYEPEAWLAERQARQQQVMQVVKRLAAKNLDPAGARAALKSLGVGESARPAQRDAMKRLADHNCQWMAELHNSTTPAQRQAAQQRLRGWEQDVRALIGSQGGHAAAGSSPRGLAPAAAG